MDVPWCDLFILLQRACQLLAQTKGRYGVIGAPYYVVCDTKKQLLKHKGRTLVRLDQVGSPEVPSQRCAAHVVVVAMVGGFGGENS